MKKLIIINLILILIYCILPQEQQNVINEGVTNIINEVIQEETETPVQNEITSNLNISFDMNLLVVSNISIEELQKAFKNTKMEGLEQYFINAEKETGINAIYLSGLACHESGWNKIGRASCRERVL